MNAFLQQFRMSDASRELWDNVERLREWLEENLSEDQMEVVEEYVNLRIDEHDYDRYENEDADAS